MAKNSTSLPVDDDFTAIYDDPSAAYATSKKAREELNGFDREIDVRKLLLTNTAGKDLNIAHAAVSGELQRSIEGSSIITITVHDQARAILKSRNLVDDDDKLRAIDIHLDGMWFRMVKFDKQGDDLVLTFEDRIVAKLRERWGPRLLGTRGKITRAQAILMLVRSIKDETFPVHINELKKEQPIVGAKKADKKQIRDRKRSKGFDDGKIYKRYYGGTMSEAELNQAAEVIAEAERLGAPLKAILAVCCACYVETDFKNLDHGDSSSVGILQLLDIHFGGSVSARMNVEKVVDRFLKGPSFTGAMGGLGAIALARKYPNMSPGQIAGTIQGAQAGNTRYIQAEPLAKKLVEGYGATGGALSGRQIFKPTKFRVERHETYWDAIQRLAKEVEWRAFVSAGEFYYISEDDLYVSRSRWTIDEGTGGIFNIDGSQDYRRRSKKITIDARIDRWKVPPGALLTVENMGSLDGKYLVASITRQLYDASATIEAKFPTHEKREPRPEVRNQGSGARTANPSDVKGLGDAEGAKAIVERLFQIALAAGGDGVYVGSAYRPGSVVGSGAPSDHSSNNAYRAARDIGVRGIDLLRGPPSPKLDRAVVAIGAALGRDYGNGKSGPFQNADNIMYKGFRIQIIWRTPQWGGHMGHIHCGCDWRGQGQPPSLRPKDKGSSSPLPGLGDVNQP